VENDLIDRESHDDVVSQGDIVGQTSEPKIAVIVPCFNEALTIAKVCDDFRTVLPLAELYVYDNNSTDGTGDIARAHGATVRLERRQGKGYTMRQAFREIDADVYVMIDGDDTYPVESIGELLAPVLSGDADLVLGDRLSNDSYASENKRQFHSFGNDLVRWMIKRLYGTPIKDAMTGYRAMTRTFVKSFPMLAKGFEIEVEMDIEAIDKNWRVAEVSVIYRDRPAGSFSKLSTVRDGAKVLAAVLGLFKDYKPLLLFSLFGAIAFAAGLALGIPTIFTFFRTGEVRLPTVLLASGICLAGMLSLVCGLILDTIVKANHKDYEVTVLNHYQRIGQRG